MVKLRPHAIKHTAHKYAWSACGRGMVFRCHVPGVFSARARRPSGQLTTFRNRMFSSATPASFSTSIAVIAEPPVASCGTAVCQQRVTTRCWEQGRVATKADANHGVAEHHVEVRYVGGKL